MTAHNKNTKKRTKSKIILPKKPYTKLLPKKRKSTKNINRIDKIKTKFYNKMKFNTIKASPKIQYSLTIYHKVHSLLVDHLTRRRINQITS
jgi:hypothetical protein